MAGNILLNYITAVDFTITALHSVAASQTFVAGWSSVGIDNSTDEFEDYHVAGSFVTAGSNRQVGQIKIYAYAVRGTTSEWPDLFSAGTEGAEGTATIHSAEVLEGGLILLKSLPVNAVVDEVYTLPPMSIAKAFGGKVPLEWALYITTDATTTTTAALAASGSVLTSRGIHRRFT